ncbi:dUTP diphosphatase [Acholeplasma granularum]|uniref:dUTP diphosphatase n=1 Tax=Acholeplasma granularum TaxID=264635 RepID=UPI00047070F2|nr:dUTP diphosphatase [Acholeplasma granularum]
MRKFEIVTSFMDKFINLPKRATKYSAGYDIESAIEISINPGEIKKIDTGIKVFMDKDEVLMIYPRSSLGIKKGLITSNAVGIIDRDYYNNPDNEGHIMIPLYNFSKEIVHIKKGERIAQGIFQKYLITEDDDANSERIGGFGSSGK